MAYITYYRKYRPLTFEEVIGQEHITTTLQNAIKLDRVVHAYLFCGPRGTGKTTVARILAKSLNCKDAPTPSPCNKCIICQRINSGFTLDVIEIDGASNRGIEEIRELREKIKFVPSEGKYKVYIIDEVHMLTTEAFNALLKTLEEPPRHSIFVLATTAPYKLPTTILSRCQRFDFRRIKIDDIKNRLRYVATKEKLKIDNTTLYLIAKQTDGSMRDALSILDQLVSYKGKNITQVDIIELLGMLDNAMLINFVEMIANGDTKKCIELVNNAVDEGKDVGQIIKGLIECFRDLLLVKTCKGDIKSLLFLPTEYIEEFIELANKFTEDRLLSIINNLSELENIIRWETNKRLFLEVMLIKLTSETLNKPEEKIVIDKEITVDLKRIKDNWYKVLDKLKEERRISIFSLLTDAKIVNFTNHNLVLGFSKDAEFNKEKIEDKKNKDIVEKVLEEVFNEKINIKCILIEDSDEHELVDYTLEKFPGGKIVE